MNMGPIHDLFDAKAVEFGHDWLGNKQLYFRHYIDNDMGHRVMFQVKISKHMVLDKWYLDMLLYIEGYKFYDITVSLDRYEINDMIDYIKRFNKKKRVQELIMYVSQKYFTYNVSLEVDMTRFRYKVDLYNLVTDVEGTLEELRHRFIDEGGKVENYGIGVIRGDDLFDYIFYINEQPISMLEDILGERNLL